MTPFSLSAGEKLFAEGDPSDCLHILEQGRVEATVRLPGGAEMTLAEPGNGALLGELSFLVDGRRTATVSAIEPTRGWTLDRRGFESLHLDGRPGAIMLLRRVGALAVARLRSRYEQLAVALGDVPDPPGSGDSSQAPRTFNGAVEREYLATLLCFRRFDSLAQVSQLVEGLAAREAPRGDTLIREGERPQALLLVVRGAVEVSVRRAGATRRVRLAGPGRFVGHLGVLDDEPNPILARARERSVLLEFPRESVTALLDDPSPTARCFAAAVYEDTARALRQANRPVSALIAARKPKPQAS